MEKKSGLNGNPTSLIGVLLFSLLNLNHFLRNTSPRLTGVRGTNPLPFNHFFLSLSVKIVFPFFYLHRMLSLASRLYCLLHLLRSPSMGDRFLSTAFRNLYPLFYWNFGNKYFEGRGPPEAFVPLLAGAELNKIEKIMEKKKEWLDGSPASLLVKL